MRYDDVAWLVACGALSGLGLVAAFLTYRKRGWSPAFRVAGWALLPIAIWLTGLAKLVFTTAVAAVDWAGNVAFNPRVWVGLALFLVSFVALGGAGAVRRRRHKALEAKAADAEAATGAGGTPGATAAIGTGQAGTGAQPDSRAKPAKAKAKAKGSKDDPLEGFEDIEDILKKRGIS